MGQDLQTPPYWIASRLQDVVNVGAQWNVGAGRARAAASQDVLACCRQGVAAARARGAEAFSTAMALTAAGLDTGFDQLARIAAARDLQEIVRLQMTWGPNQMLAICQAVAACNRPGAAPGGNSPQTALR